MVVQNPFYLLRVAKKILSLFDFKGKYILVEIFSKLFNPECQPVIGFVGGFKTSLDFRDSLQRQIYFGIFDIDETRLIRNLLSEGDIFLDIGANIGYYSLIGAHFVGETGKVHAFEPVSVNYRHLLETISEGDIKQIKLNQLAVGEGPGFLSLYVPEIDLGNSGWASIVPSSKRRAVIEVEMISIDVYLKQNNIKKVRLIKLDIEGYELEAFLGAGELLSGKDPPDIICEVNLFLLNKRQLQVSAITQLLKRYGYSIYVIHDGKIIPFEKFIYQEFAVFNLYCTIEFVGVSGKGCILH